MATLAAGTLTAPLALRAAGGHGGGAFSTLAAPLPTNAPGKIEVIQFLWCGCPHCAKVEPFVEAWEKTLPSDVVFGREHIVWEAQRETLAHAPVFVTQRTLDLVQYGEVIVGRSASFAEPAAQQIEFEIGGGHHRAGRLGTGLGAAQQHLDACDPSSEYAKGFNRQSLAPPCSPRARSSINPEAVRRWRRRRAIHMLPAWSLLC